MRGPTNNTPAQEALKDLEAINRLLKALKVQIDGLPDVKHSVPNALVTNAIERVSDLFDFVSLELDSDHVSDWGKNDAA